MKNNYLIHYGILGMKWGVRRFQNEDGTRTEAGKKREKAAKADSDKKSVDNKLFKQNIKGGKDKPNISPAEQAVKNTGKVVDETANIAKSIHSIRSRKSPADYSSMSDQELRERINRINMERQLSQLTQEETNAGYETLRDVLSIVGSVVGITSAVVGTYATFHNLKK